MINSFAAAGFAGAGVAGAEGARSRGAAGACEAQPARSAAVRHNYEQYAYDFFFITILLF
jgi:hypothetical protein